MPLTKTQGGLIAAVVLTVVVVVAVSLALNWDAVVGSAQAPMEAVRAAVKRLEIKPKSSPSETAAAPEEEEDDGAVHIGDPEDFIPFTVAPPHVRGTTRFDTHPVVRSVVQIEGALPSLEPVVTRRERTETKFDPHALAQGVVLGEATTTAGPPTAGQYIDDFVIGSFAVPQE